MQWEVEQKFRISDLAATEASLAELGVRLADPVWQDDRYFNHPARDFQITDEALRLRQVENDNFITYKGPKIDADTKTRRELEIALPPGRDSLHQFAELLTALGFRAVGTVRKARRPGKLAWENHDVEVVLDEVEGLGSFIELEIAAEDSTLDAAKAALKDVAQRLGLNQPERRSYLELTIT